MTLRILQHGCLGTRNYGDERSALAVRTLVRQTHPDAEFYLIGSDAAAIQKEHKDVTDWATRDNWSKVEALMAKADLWIYGPGTVLGPNPMPKTLDLMAMGKPFIIWGAGSWDMIPPESDGAKVVKAAAAVTVRDTFAGYAVSQHRQDERLVPDPMFLETAWAQRTKHAICVSWHLARQSESVQDHVLGVLAKALEALDGHWIAIPASWSETTDWDNDHVLHRKLVRLFPECDLVWPKDFDDLRIRLAEVDLIITSRLHMAIPVLGGGGRAVFFGQPKCEAMVDTLQIGECYAGNYEDMTVASVVAAVREARPLTASVRWNEEHYTQPAVSGRLMAQFIERAIHA
jgi:polysaccharide pyruvyl transferase WcaK-like protein